MAFKEALACLFVPLAKRLNLGTVIGYLVAGVAAGLSLDLSFSDHPEELLHFAKFGVVLFLFVIGLEFRPRRLWELRGTIFDAASALRGTSLVGLSHVAEARSSISWSASGPFAHTNPEAEPAILLPMISRWPGKSSASQRSSWNHFRLPDGTIVEIIGPEPAGAPLQSQIG